MAYLDPIPYWISVSIPAFISSGTPVLCNGAVAWGNETSWEYAWQCPLLVEHMVPALAGGHELQSWVAAAQTGFGSTGFTGLQGVGGV